MFLYTIKFKHSDHTIGCDDMLTVDIFIQLYNLSIGSEEAYESSWEDWYWGTEGK